MRRRSPPPPRGRDDRGPPPPQGSRGRYPPPPRGAGDRRRPRSITPDRFRRSPPPPKRFRGREPDYDYPDYDRYPGSGGRDGYGRRGGYGPGGYPRGRPDDRYDRDRSPPPRSRDQPMPFREFILTLADDVTPEAAKEAFSSYLANWWGDAIKAEFEQRKAEQGLRKRFDPREIQKLMAHRNECAKVSAARFAEDLAEGRLDPVDEGFHQADDGSAPGPDGYADADAKAGEGSEEASAPPPRAPALCWGPTQLAADLALARQVMQLLDKEKGVEENPLAAAEAAEAATGGAGAGAADGDRQGEGEGGREGREGIPQTEAAAEGEKAGEAAPVANGEAAEEQGGDAAGEGTGGEQPQRPGQEEGGAKGSAAAVENGDALTPTADAEMAEAAERLPLQQQKPLQQQQPQQPSTAGLAGKLDQVLAYLWRVHGVDYYGGREYYDPEEPGRAAARRTLRQPPPPPAPASAAAAAPAGEGEKEGAPAIKAEAAEEGEGAEPAAANKDPAKPAAAGEDAAAASKDDAPSKEAGAAAAAVAAPPAAAEAAKEAPGSGKEVAAVAPAPGAAAKRREKELAEERERYDHRVTGFWRYRLDHPDPLEPPLQRKRVEEAVAAFIEDQVIMHDEKKWGNKLSSKLFVAREFVIKHIRNKHGHVLDAERDKVLDTIYFDNFRAFKEEEQRQQREAEEAARRRRAGGPGAEEEGGAEGALDGGRAQRGMGGMPLLDPTAMVMDPTAMVLDPSMAMMGAGQIFLPGPGGMMMPVIMDPTAMVMGGGMMGAAAAGMMGGGGGLGGGGRGGRGGRAGGGRGPMRGGGGGRGGPMFGGPGAKLDAGGVREYFDLDAPANNRAVLDYGDL